MKAATSSIFKNGKVAVPCQGCALYMCLHEPPRRFPPSQRAGGVAPAAAAVTCRRWRCTLTTDERGSASSTISLLERHVRCGGPRSEEHTSELPSLAYFVC